MAPHSGIREVQQHESGKGKKVFVVIYDDFPSGKRKKSAQTKQLSDRGMVFSEHNIRICLDLV